MAIISPLTYTIANGQAVDATPLMADLNQIVSNVNANAAALAGSSSQVFNVANATTSTEAVNLGQAQAEFAALNGSPSQVFNVANATTSTEAVALGQLAQQTPVGNVASAAGVTTLSLTSSAFTAPCTGKAIVLFGGSNAATSANSISTSASLAGFQLLYAQAFGALYDAYGYLPMIAGQSSTFSITGGSASSTSLFLSIKVFFIPLA